MKSLDVHPHCDPCRRSHFSQSLADDWKLVVWNPNRDKIECYEMFGSMTFAMISNHNVVDSWTYGKS